MSRHKKLKVALIFGGTSEERNVSLETAKNVAPILAKKYEVFPVEVSKEGKWLIATDAIKALEKESGTKQASSNQAIVPIDKNAQANVDLAFLALHGPGGEDGTIQGMLELLKVRYTGSGVLGSALAMDKAKTKRLVASEGINVAPHVIVTESNYKKIKLPCVVKPNRIGSSIGTSVVKSKKDLKKALDNAFKHDDQVMIEAYLKGREFTVPVLGNQNPEALPVIEIVPKISEFFDYKAKYQIGGTDEIVPAKIPSRFAKQLQEIAVRAHKLLDCKGVTRSDFIFSNNKIYFLEINTLPGMTANSLVPKSAAAGGIPFSKLLDKLIQLALE